jgi:hypothetical protein
LEEARPGRGEHRIVTETRPGSIILSHDIHPGTIKAMPATFDQLQAQGFKFVTVSELIAMGTPMPPRKWAMKGRPRFPRPPLVLGRRRFRRSRPRPA